ncbi:MAG: GGDEF domain-containing protein [Lachnospiraceae bacterium]|nr:GGDEF domain-containing protein [Lachnospiraceae bacterium]
MAYSIIGIIAILIHFIINKNDLFEIRRKDASRTKRYYSVFLLGILLYYITDSLWGILDELKLTGLLYADTVVYYLAMSLAVVLWSEYAAVYLHQNNVYGKILRYVGRGFMMLVVLALLVNLHFPIFFYFDSDGNYHAEIIRYIGLYVQIVLFMVTSIQTFYVAIKLKGSTHKRYMTMSIFGIAMTVAIVAQIEYPLLPIYSIGYMLGSCVLHIYVVEDEKEEDFAKLKHQMDIVSSMSNMFFCSYYVDVKNNSFIELGNSIDGVKFLIGKEGVASDKFLEMSKMLVLPQYASECREFTDMSTLDYRMKNKIYLSMQFEGVHTGWAEGCFIAGDRDEEGHLNHVIWAIRTIKDEKEKENQLRYNSYVDELTGLYNRKMFAEDIAEIEKQPIKDDFAFISMDVNGLKNLNDSKGHAAGDDLLKGAAKCMKECLEPYGRVYRTGGDEFCAILYATPAFINKIKEEFDERTYACAGRFFEHISVSCGIVFGRDCKDMPMNEIVKAADKNMYVAKQNYYQAKGVDRRGQRNAYNALCALYTKILKINLDTDTYSIVLMDIKERSSEKGFEEISIFSWLESFAKSGQVHEDDKEEYLKKTSKEYLRKYFAEGKTSIDIQYRRKIGDEFKTVIMEIIPAEDYDVESKSMYLYVKAIDK